MRQVFYYKMRQFYYKMWLLLQIATVLLENATFITNFDSTNSDPKHVDLSSNSVVSAVDKSKITQAFWKQSQTELTQV